MHTLLVKSRIFEATNFLLCRISKTSFSEIRYAPKSYVIMRRITFCGYKITSFFVKGLPGVFYPEMWVNILMMYKSGDSFRLMQLFWLLLYWVMSSVLTFYFLSFFCHFIVFIRLLFVCWLVKLHRINSHLNLSLKCVIACINIVCM